ncbi:MAG: hypothetical protein ABI220_03395 [Candidatus Saccharimonadales bacterium]
MEVAVPHLDYLDEFKSVLKDYRPSEASQKLFKSVPIVLLVGPTAAGRNTLINILQDTGRYRMIVSDSTRPPRNMGGVIEENGKVYWFKTEEAVLEGLRQGQYIEAAVIHNQQVSGANISEIQATLDSHKIALKEIEIQGAATYRGYNSNILCIFLLPPSFDIWMERIKSRGGMGDAEIYRRLQSSEKEIMEGLQADYYQFVVNTEIHLAAKVVDELANGRPAYPEKQAQGRQRAGLLLKEIRQYLAKPR